ncbi:RagB/SusD family nutrient uptake outer membrane protein [Pedobacter nutrimenti]|uniref:Putative outer membrane starch-binding protein n=1 Tax=Pedobacter nutrimenti TaxID=1241337 RepID=A0A318UN98_9SPHI|nr:RagB/SusD family nutrient uptake outer membrane protein [Pedobacter nutrimenti]PYF76927.1 putative outer membrane starch-binding protein [Pedobacter nutrimenti]
MYHKIYMIFFLLLVLTGCKKDPSLVGPTDAYSTSTYPKSINDLQSVLAPGYSNLRSLALYGFELMPKAMANAVHTSNGNYGDVVWKEWMNNNLSVTNTFSANAWSALYTGVKNCNVTLQAADFFEQNYAKPADLQMINYIRGQALFLRAFYYFQLECFYGESYIKGTIGADKMGVPLYDKIPADVASTQQPRAKTRQVWDFIISDLKKSADLLKGKVWSGADVGRVSEWAAKGLLGKAYVFTEDWTNAKTVLLDVIQHSNKFLMPYDKYRNAFVGITANEFNEESLFELNVDKDAKGDYGPYGNNPNATTLNGMIWSPSALGLDGTETSAKGLGYTGNGDIHDQNIKRFGYPLGYYTLVNNPKFNSAKPASYSNPKMIMDPVYKQAAQNVRDQKLADPRLYVNTVQPWLDSLKFDGSNWAPVSKPAYLAGQLNTYGWGYRKYAALDYPIETVQADACNWYFLRLADVFLLYAEAAKGSGDQGTALEYLNKVKRRAYGYPVDAPSPVDYGSLTAQTKAIGDPVLGNNPLYYERWAELFNEGQWWFDVCRWRLGKSEAAYFGSTLTVSNLQFNESKSYSWPIPQDEFNSNAKIAGQQNPGY